MTYNSKFQGEVKHGSAQTLVRYYEKLAYDAERSNEIVLMHLYFQHAEHYKRV